MSICESSKSLLSQLDSIEYHSEPMGMQKENNCNLRGMEVISGMPGDPMVYPPKQARPEYLWENFPNEFGDQWQSLGPDDNRPHSSPEKTSEKYLSEQGSKQLRSSSDMVYRSFKAGSSGFRSREDYKKAVENHTKWWNKMNAKKNMWLSKERIVNSADQDANSKLQSLIIDPKRYSSTDSGSSDDNVFEKYSPASWRESDKSFGNKYHANFDSPTLFAQWRDETTRFAKKLGIWNGSPEGYPSSNVRKDSSSCSHSRRTKLPVEEISRNTLGQTKTSREKDQQKKQRPLRATILPPSLPVPHPHSSKYLQSGSDSRGSRQKLPISGRKKLESFKTVDRGMSHSRNSSDSSKQSTTSGKRELESLRSINVKSDSNINAHGTGRKKWIKTPRKEKMSLRNKSTRRLLPIKSCSDCFSEASDSSSVKRWNTVWQSAKVNGLLKVDASRNSSSKRMDQVGDLVLSKKLGVYEASKLAEESHNKPHKRKDASKLKSEVTLDPVSLATITELQNELASLKLMMNSKKKKRSRMSRDSRASDDSSRDLRASSLQGACSENCSLITAFLPILFSHECYSKKLKMFEEYNQRQLLPWHVKNNAPVVIPETNLLIDGLDGKTKSVYVIQSLPTDRTACNTTCQQKDKSASPKLLSYRSVEQMPNEKPKNKSTMEKSTQTELSIPVMNNCGASDKLRSVGTQCNEEHEIKLEKTCGRVVNRPTIWQFGPDNSMGVTFKSTCNVMEIPCSSFQRLQKNKQKAKDEPNSKEPKLIISPAELKTARGVVEKLMSGEVSDKDETRKETARELEEKVTTFNGNSCQTFSQKISIELPEDSRKSLSRRSQDSVIESIDEVDEQEQKSLSKGPSKKKSKLMTHSPPESAVESKEENATRQKKYESFSGPSCNAGKKFCHRRRLLKSVAKPTPFKFTKSE